MVADTGDYRLHLTVRDSEIRAKVVNSTCLYVNYDYSLKTYPRDIRAHSQESVLWTFSFKNPSYIVPVFLINIKISYSNSTASANMVQLISREISSNTTRDIQIEFSEKVLPFYNRSRVVYQPGRLTIEIRELSKEDSGSFQAVLILGSKEGTHRQSYLVDNVALFMVEDHTPIVNNTCNVTTCSMSPAKTQQAHQVKGLAAALAISAVALIVITTYSVHLKNKKGSSDQRRDKNKEGSSDLGSDKNKEGSSDIGSDKNKEGSSDLGSDKNKEGSSDLGSDKNKEGSSDIGSDKNKEGSNDLRNDKNKEGSSDLGSDKNKEGSSDLGSDINKEISSDQGSNKNKEGSSDQGSAQVDSNDPDNIPPTTHLMR